MNLSLLVIIAPTLLEKKYLDVLNKYKVKFKAVTYAKGTASSSILEYFGLNEIDKIVFFAILPQIAGKHLLRYSKMKLKISEPGNGISFTIPLSSSTKYMQDFYKNNKLEDFEMEKEMQHLIITIANEGFAEMVMNAAKKAGATGGTTISGRGLENEKIVKFLGISIEPEKDIVLILASEDKKKPIMNEIVSACGLKTPGAGICFSLPVENVIGLME